jgi:hypothetical protein
MIYLHHNEPHMSVLYAVEDPEPEHPAQQWLPAIVPHSAAAICVLCHSSSANDLS